MTVHTVGGEPVVVNAAGRQAARIIGREQGRLKFWPERGYRLGAVGHRIARGIGITSGGCSPPTVLRPRWVTRARNGKKRASAVDALQVSVSEYRWVADECITRR